MLCLIAGATTAIDVVVDRLSQVTMIFVMVLQNFYFDGFVELLTSCFCLYAYCAYGKGLFS